MTILPYFTSDTKSLRKRYTGGYHWGPLPCGSGARGVGGLLAAGRLAGAIVSSDSIEVDKMDVDPLFSSSISILI